MSSVKFIRKTPAGGAGNFNYEFSCSCSGGAAKPNVVVTSANDNQARALAQLECDDSCGESRSQYVDVPVKEFTAQLESLTAMPEAKSGTWVNYSFQDRVFWTGDRLYGSWSQELSFVCSNAGTDGFYYQLQIVSGPEYVGICSGRPVIKIETR